MARSRDYRNSVRQKPFRCSIELESRLNRTKGAIMMKTGQRISDNQFMIQLIELGLERLTENLSLEKY